MTLEEFNAKYLQKTGTESGGWNGATAANADGGLTLGAFWKKYGLEGDVPKIKGTDSGTEAEVKTDYVRRRGQNYIQPDAATGRINATLPLTRGGSGLTDQINRTQTLRGNTDRISRTLPLNRTESGGVASDRFSQTLPLKERSFSDYGPVSGIVGGTAENLSASLISATATLGDAFERQRTRETAMLNDMNRRLGSYSTNGAGRSFEEPKAAESPNRALWDRLYEAADKLSDSAAQDLQTVKNSTGWLGQAAVDVAENVMEMGFDAGVAMLTGGSSLVPMAARTFGSSAQEARQAGASLDQQLAYGVTKGAIEVATEKLFDGVAHIYGAGAADEITEEVIRKLAKTDTGRTALRLLVGAAGEGVEEVISDLLSPLAERIYNDDAMQNGYFQALDPSEILYDYLIGATVGALGGGATLLTGQNAAANAELAMRDALENTQENAAPIEGTASTGLTLGSWGESAQENTVPNEVENIEIEPSTRASAPTNGEVGPVQKGRLYDGTIAQPESVVSSAYMDKQGDVTRAPDAQGPENTPRASLASPSPELTVARPGEEVNTNSASGLIWAGSETEGGTTNVSREATEASTGQEQTVSAAGTYAGAAAAPDRADAWAEAVEPAGAEVSDRSGGRDAGVGPGGEAERVVTSPEERRARAAEQGRRAAARQGLGNDLWERGEVELQSARELGIKNGSETPELKVFPHEHWDEEMREAADWAEREHGLSVTYVSGVIRVETPGGARRARGVYTGDGIVIQADNRNESVTSLVRHEVFHDEAARDAGLMEAMRAELAAQYGPEELRSILRGYILNLRGAIDGALDMDNLDETAMQILEEVCADAAGGINAFGLGAYQYENTVERVRGERAALRDQQADGVRETRGPPDERASINAEFGDEVQAWYDETKPHQRTTAWGYFQLGTTSDALQSIGTRADNIYMRKYKIGTILEDHPDIDIDVVKQVPEILENPILIMKSRTQPDSVVLFGDVRATNGDTVMAALQLTPQPGGNTEAEFSLVTSAYDRTDTSIRNLINNSELLYLDPNKNRTNNWLMQLRVQFPSGQPPFGPIGTISYAGDGVNITGKTLQELGGTIKATDGTIGRDGEPSANAVGDNEAPSGAIETRVTARDGVTRWPEESSDASVRNPSEKINTKFSMDEDAEEEQIRGATKMTEPEGAGEARRAELDEAMRQYARETGANLPDPEAWRGNGYDEAENAEAQETTEQDEMPEDTSLHLPSPPGEEAEPTRQRELERREKRLVRKRRGDKEHAAPVTEYIKAAQARSAAAAAEQLARASKADFTATPALDKLGVRVEGSVGNYARVDQLLARERAARGLRKTIRRREAALKATAKEKAFAAGMAEGVYTAEDIPATMSRGKLEELADYYWAEKSLQDDMIAQRRKEINRGLDETMEGLLQDSDLYKVPKAVVLSYRTPERLCRTIWGDEHGRTVYDAVFRPVSVNEAEKTRFTNRMFDEVRTFEGEDGKRSKLNKDERMLVQQVLEGRAVAELVASNEMHAAIENAAENIRNGESSLDSAREFGLSGEERGIAEQYARWLETKEVYDSGDFDTVKIDNAVEKYSELYDQMYDAINDFLAAHGYEPIGFIKGYAPHMQMEEDLSLFAGYLDRLGLNTNVTRLPASIAGRTADFRPNKRWNPYFLQRTGDLTDFDIAKGFQSYVGYLGDVLYHTDDIMRIRAMSRYYRRTFAPEEVRATLDWVHTNELASTEVKEDMLKDRDILSRDSKLSSRDIEATFDEWVGRQYDSVKEMTKYSDYVSYLDNYANILAGKQSSLDRGAEALLGRESLTLGNKLVQSFARTQVAGNLSSALNQSAQLPQIRAELGAKYTAKAVADLMSGAARKGAWAQESDFLTGKHGVDMLVTDAFDMAMEWAFKPATFVDGLMSTIAVRGKYLQQVDAGKSHAEAMRAADDFGRSIMGSRVKGEKPVAFQSKKLGTQMLNLFQIEALNSWEHLSQDLPADFRAIEKQRGTKKAAAAVAGVIVKTLLSAFVLNRLGEEVYGGTPAPFDLLGLSANFVASGKGLTTNQWIRTVIDNGMEKLTGSRIFSTDPDDMRDGFDLDDAWEDVSYNVMNDVPFLRNIAALMGWGDQTLPLPLMGAGADLDHLRSDLKSDWSEGRLSAETGMDLGRIALQAIPGGRQITKTAEGTQLILQGGRYVKDKLYYPVENSLTNWIKALLFGRSSLYGNDAYYAGDDKYLSEKQTEAYRALVEDGADRFVVYETIQRYRAANSDDDLGSFEKGRRKRAAITDADLTDAQRLTLFRDLGNESRAEDFEAIMSTGLSWAKTVRAYDQWAELNAAEDMNVSDKAKSFKAWVAQQGYTVAQRTAVEENFMFWRSVPVT